jgi:hypothetical protein
MRIDSAGDVNITTGDIKMVTAGKGIDFSGIGTAAEILDDYEEGTWTPKLQDGTLSDLEGVTYWVQNASYIKIGSRVFYQGNLVVNSTGTLTGGVNIAGLPYTSKSSGEPPPSPVIVGQASSLALPSAGDSVGGWVGSGRTYIQMHKWSLTGGTDNLTAAEWSSQGGMIFGGSYEV